MRRREFISAAAAPALAAAALPARGQDARAPLSPLDAGARTQYLDSSIVRETRAVAFTLHPGEKHPGNPLVRADREWEGWRVLLYGNVVYDSREKLFKMWYLCEPPPGVFPFKNVTLYATSEDGVRWRKPAVGTLHSLRPLPHNAVAHVDLASVILDDRDPDPSRRYKMITFIKSKVEPRGHRTLVSPDGLNWRVEPGGPIAQGDDVITGYYDEHRGLYVALVKQMVPVRGTRRRCFALITSRNFRSWTSPEMAWVPDPADDAGSLRRIEEARPLLDVPDNPALIRTEFYGLGFYPAESCTVAFPWVFTVNNQNRYDSNQEGPGEIQIGFSRDLQHWDRPFRTPAVPRGRVGEWDSGFFSTQSRALRVGDEVRLYYCGSNYTHGTPALYQADGAGRGTKYTSGIGMTRWKLDRFFSADGHGPESRVTTVPLVFDGDRLELNASVSQSGSITVEMLDAAGRPLDGFGRSSPVRGDGLRLPVRWSKPATAFRDRPVTLRFHLSGAQLFAFSFRRV